MSSLTNIQRHFKTSFFKKLFLGFFVMLMLLTPVLTPLSQENGFQVANIEAQARPDLDGAGSAVDPNDEISNPEDGSNESEAECGVGGIFGFGGGTIQGCIVWAMYYVIYYPASLFLAFTGIMFDAVVPVSLSSEVIGGGTGTEGNIVETGWGIMRDIVNSVFIFIVLYIAISLILQIGARDAKRTLVTLIIVALLVNFSLFFSKIIIDASNVAAIQFYQTIGEEKTQEESVTTRSALKLPERTLSVSVVNGLQPQQLIGKETWKVWAGENAPDGEDGNPDVGSYIFLFIIAAIVNLMAAVAFFAAAAVFIARVVILWFLMILSPVAFAAFILPKTRGQAQKWLSMLFSQSFVAPIFFLLFYILVTFIDNEDNWKGFFQEADSADTLLARLVIITLIGAFYILLLMFITGITVRMSSAAGNAGLRAGKFVAGSAVGGYVGAYAAGGRQSIGRGARAYANQKDENGETRASRWKQQGGFAKYGAYGLERTAGSSFDTRNTRAGAAAAGAAGIGGSVGRGQQGGFEKSVQDRVQERKDIEAGIVNPEKRSAYGRQIENEGAVFGGTHSQTAREFQRDVQRQESQYKTLQSPEAKAEFISRADADIAKKLYEDESGYERAKLEKAVADMAQNERARGTEEGEQIASKLETVFAPMAASIQDRERISGTDPEDPQSLSYRQEQEARQKDASKGKVQLAKENYAKADGQDTPEKAQTARTSALNDLSKDERKALFQELSAAEQDRFLDEEHGDRGVFEGSLSEEAKRKLNSERQKNADLKERVANQDAARGQNNRARELHDSYNNGESQEMRQITKDMGRHITELDEQLLQRNEVMENLTNSQLAALQKQGKMSDATIDAIRNKYENNPNSMTASARNYFTHSPARMHFGMSDRTQRNQDSSNET